jgi:hypothetical protein
MADTPRDRAGSRHPTIYCGGSVRFPIRTAAVNVTDAQERRWIKKLGAIIRKGVHDLRASPTQPVPDVNPETLWYVDMDEREFVLVWRILCWSAPAQR